MFWIKNSNDPNCCFLSQSGVVVEWFRREGLVLFDNSDLPELAYKRQQEIRMTPPIPSNIMTYVTGCGGLVDRRAMLTILAIVDKAVAVKKHTVGLVNILNFLNNVVIKYCDATALSEPNIAPMLYAPRKGKIYVIRTVMNSHLFVYYEWLYPESTRKVPADSVTNEKGYEMYLDKFKACIITPVLFHLDVKDTVAKSTVVLNLETCLKWCQANYSILLIVHCHTQIRWTRDLSPFEGPAFTKYQSEAWKSIFLTMRTLR